MALPKIASSVHRFCTAVLLMIMMDIAISRVLSAEEDSRENVSRANFKFLETFCVKCHGERPAEGLSSFTGLKDVVTDTGSRPQWEMILKQVKARAMPPLDFPQPTETEREQAVRSLDRMLSWVDQSKVADPGRVTVRRLNCLEYDNTICDLFGISIKPGSLLLPDDNVGYGFDDIGDVLSMSPLRMRGYLEAAELITDALFNDGSGLLLDRRTVAATFSFKGKNKGNGEGIILWPGSSSSDDVDFPIAGEYELEISLFGLLSEDELKRRGQQDHDKWDPPLVEPDYDRDAPLTHAKVFCDEEVIKVVEAWHGGFWRKQTATMRFHTAAGQHAIRIQNDATRRYTEDDLENWESMPADAPRLGLHVLHVRGPYGVQPDHLAPHHHRLVISAPAQSEDIKKAAAVALKPLMDAAFRRPVDEQEVDTITQFVERSVAGGRTYPQALKLASQTILVSPHFLFRLELGPTPENPELIHPVGDYALASRLSYSLWKTLPDEALVNLAERNELHVETVLRSQVARMLKDSRATAFVRSFFGQWLGTQRIPDIKLDQKLYPELTSGIKNDMMTESMMFAESIMRENHSVLDILRADYTFVNKRLARYYGLDVNDWTTPGFSRVSLRDLPRRGVLTQAGVLILTSYPNRTSPTKRGKWILETILNDEPPAAPPDAPPLESKDHQSSGQSLRQQLEEHRRNPRCASCHQIMDQIGFGFENFDASGRWRDKDGARNVDSTGMLPSGESFSGPVDLIQILSQREEDFVRCFVEKLMTFSLGRGIESYDRLAIDQIIQNTKQSGYRFNDLIAEIILSRPFLMQRGEGNQP